MGAFNYTVETTDAGKTWVERKTLMPPPPEGSVPKKPADETIDPTAPKKTVAGCGRRRSLCGGDGRREPFERDVCRAPTPNTLFMAAEAGAVYRSLDGGVTWDEDPDRLWGSFWGGLTAKDGTVYATGMRGNIWRSTDKGATLAKLDTSGADQSIATGIQLNDGSLRVRGAWAARFSTRPTARSSRSPTAPTARA